MEELLARYDAGEAQGRAPARGAASPQVVLLPRGGHAGLQGRALAAVIALAALTVQPGLLDDLRPGAALTCQRSAVLWTGCVRVPRGTGRGVPPVVLPLLGDLCGAWTAKAACAVTVQASVAAVRSPSATALSHRHTAVHRLHSTVQAKHTSSDSVLMAASTPSAFLSLTSPHWKLSELPARLPPPLRAAQSNKHIPSSSHNLPLPSSPPTSAGGRLSQEGTRTPLFLKQGLSFGHMTSTQWQESSRNVASCQDRQLGARLG